MKTFTEVNRLRYSNEENIKEDGTFTTLSPLPSNSSQILTDTGRGDTPKNIYFNGLTLQSYLDQKKIDKQRLTFPQLVDAIHHLLFKDLQEYKAFSRQLARRMSTNGIGTAFLNSYWNHMKPELQTQEPPILLSEERVCYIVFDPAKPFAVSIEENAWHYPVQNEEKIPNREPFLQTQKKYTASYNDNRFHVEFQNSTIWTNNGSHLAITSGFLHWKRISDISAPALPVKSSWLVSLFQAIRDAVKWFFSFIFCLKTKQYSHGSTVKINSIHRGGDKEEKLTGPAPEVDIQPTSLAAHPAANPKNPVIDSGTARPKGPTP